MAEWERPSLSSGSNPRSAKTRGAKPHRLRWAIIAAAVAATVGFGWVSWSAYRSGGASSGAIVPFLKADTEPTRVRPDNPGGMPIPNQDKTIYDELDPRRAPPKGAERLLPPPETPVSRPPAATAADDSEASGTKPSIPSLGENGQPPAREVGSASVKAPPVEPEQPPAPPSAAVPSPFTKLVAPPAQPKSAAKPSSRDQSASVSPSSPPATKAPAPGSVRVQLGAVGTESAAHKEWERIRRANTDLLGSMSPAIVRADLGVKGVVYRIQAGPVADADAAAGLCAKLKTRNVGCFVAR
jgi:cell division septation protein DedD